MKTQIGTRRSSSLARLLGLVILVTSVLSGSSLPVRAAALCVNPGGTNGCYATIRDAVAAASHGDTINVASGTYFEHDILIDKSLTLLGDPGDGAPGPGPGAPILDGNGLPGNAFDLANGVANVTIRGFEIRNFTSGGTGNGSGVSAWVPGTSNITIQDNRFHDLGWNAVLVGNDGRMGDHYNWTIRANTIERWDAYGLELINASGVLIENNTITSDASGEYRSTMAILVSARRSESGITIRGNLLTGKTSSTYPPVLILANGISSPNISLTSVVIQHNEINTVGGFPYQVYLREIGGATVSGVHINNNSLSTLRALTAMTVDAEHNWWGNGSGPLDPQDENSESAEVPSCEGVTAEAMMNTDGAVGLVGGNVDYCPWTTSALLVTVSEPKDATVVIGALNHLKVTFSNDVRIDASIGTVLDPASYLLFEDGVDNLFNTQACVAGIQADDTIVAVNSVSYDAATHTATLFINNGMPLAPGMYRLLICGAGIEDRDRNRLNYGLHDTPIWFGIVNNPVSLPATGFPPGVMTVLPARPAEVVYSVLDMWLEIPEIGVRASIVEIPQTDSGTWDVTWLDTEIGWLHGTASPNAIGNAVLTAHLTLADGSPGPFYKLRDLGYGDRIILHSRGHEYIYVVSNSQITLPSNTAYAFDSPMEKPYLTLVTCQGYMSSTGEYLWRRLIRAEFVGMEDE